MRQDEHAEADEHEGHGAHEHGAARRTMPRKGSEATSWRIVPAISGPYAVRSRSLAMIASVARSAMRAATPGSLKLAATRSAKASELNYTRQE